MTKQLKLSYECREQFRSLDESLVSFAARERARAAEQLLKPSPQ